MRSAKKSVSIKDIARAAGVTPGTVSRALHDSPRVHPKTRRQIQRIAGDMAYVPSAVARSLVTQRTYTLGVVVTTITDLFLAEVFTAIEETAWEFNYRVLLTNSRGEPAREIEAIRSLRERRVDGIVLISGCTDCDADCLQILSGLPVIMINNAHNVPIWSSVQVDNVTSSKEACQHLLELGHTRVAHIAGPACLWDSEERRRGYEQALDDYGIGVDPSLIVAGDSLPMGGMEAMRRLLALEHPPSAVSCYNDVTALGAMRASRGCGLSIPDDISIVGFDDIDLAAYLETPLTTVAQPKHRMGEKAVRMIMELVAGAEQVADCVLPGRLVIRDSTMPPGAASALASRGPVRGLQKRS